MHQVRMSVGIMMTVLMLLSSSGVHARMQEAASTPVPETGEVVTNIEETPVAPEATEAPEPTIPPAPPVEGATGPAPERTEEVPANPGDEINPPTGPPAGDEPVSEPAPVEGPVVDELVSEDPDPVNEVETPVIDAGEPEPGNESEEAATTAALTSNENDESDEAPGDTGIMMSQVEETLTVTVLGPDGHPLPRAYVTVRNDDWMLSGEGVTNAHGVVVLSDLGGGAAYHVDATALDGLQGAGTVSRHDGAPNLTLTIHLEARGFPNDSVSIEALDFQRGEFVSGATYSIYDASGNLLHTITAGENERSIDVTGLAEGFYSVMVTADGYQPGYGQFFMPQATSVTVLITERSSFTFNLTVSDAESGAPIAGATVTIHGGTGNQMASGATDVTGVMSTSLLNKGYAYEEYTVSVNHPGYLPASQIFTIDDPAQPTTMAIALEPVPPTTISVVDEDANGVPDANVTVIRAGGGGPINGTTDPDGIFPIAGLIDGDYTVSVTKNGYETGNATFTYPTQGPVVIQLASEHPDDAAYITFLVHDARTGEPIEGATLIAVDRHEQFVTQGISGPDGSWTTRNDGSADSILVSAPGYRAWRVLVPAPESGIESRSVPLYQLVTGVLVDDVTGEPIANAEVTHWELRSPHVRYATTAEDGSFSFFFNPYPHGEVIRFRARSSPDYVTTTYYITMDSAVPFIELRLTPVTQGNDGPDNSASHGTLTTSFTLCANADCAAPHDTSLDGSTVTWTVTGQDGSAFVLPGTMALASAGSGGAGMTLQAQTADQHEITAVLEGGIATGSLDLPVGRYTVCLQPKLTGADGAPTPLADEAACDTVLLTEDGIIGGPLAFGAVVDGGVTVTQPDAPAQEQDEAPGAPGAPATGTDSDDATADETTTTGDTKVSGTSVKVSGLPSAGTSPESGSSASIASMWLMASAIVLLLAAIGLRQRGRAQDGRK